MIKKAALVTCLLACAFAICCCDSAPQPQREALTIHPDKQEYALNEKIVITIGNQTEATIRLVDCCDRVGFVVEREAAGGWDLVDALSCPALCDAFPMALPSGQQHREEITVSVPGQYRLAGKYIDETESSLIGTIHSEGFTVQ